MADSTHSLEFGEEAAEGQIAFWSTPNWLNVKLVLDNQPAILFALTIKEAKALYEVLGGVIEEFSLHTTQRIMRLLQEEGKTKYELARELGLPDEKVVRALEILLKLNCVYERKNFHQDFDTTITYHRLEGKVR